MLTETGTTEAFTSTATTAAPSRSSPRATCSLLGAIAGISLLVGGIGIMNIMLVTVTERTREIGIRKAIGAERKSIIAQFLIEAAMICSIGGLIGIAIGYVGTMVAGKLLLSTTTDVLLPSPIITLGAFLFSVALGVIFGMYPAVKASGLQPVVALRAACGTTPSFCALLPGRGGSSGRLRFPRHTK